MEIKKNILFLVLLILMPFNTVQPNDSIFKKSLQFADKNSGAIAFGFGFYDYRLRDQFLQEKP